MKRFFSSPKRAIGFIVFILFCVMMLIGGITMGLSMGSMIQ